TAGGRHLGADLHAIQIGPGGDALVGAVDRAPGDDVGDARAVTGLRTAVDRIGVGDERVVVDTPGRTAEVEAALDVRSVGAEELGADAGRRLVSLGEAGLDNLLGAGPTEVGVCEVDARVQHRDADAAAVKAGLVDRRHQ